MRTDQSPCAGRDKPLAVVVSSLSSDAHTWNLVYIQLLLEELGHDVTNLGACVPDADLAAHCRAARPDLIVISSVNGHGFADGMRVIALLRESPELITTPVVIGGKLDTTGGSPVMAQELLGAGFDAVFTDGAPLAAFRSFVDFVAGLPAPAASPLAVSARPVPASSPVGA
jgi:methylaspartate mutase sigma subunit